MTALADNFGAPEVDRRKVLLGLLFGSAAALAAWRQPSKRLDYLGREKLDSYRGFTRAQGGAEIPS